MASFSPVFSSYFLKIWADWNNKAGLQSTEFDLDSLFHELQYRGSLNGIILDPHCTGSIQAT